MQDLYQKNGLKLSNSLAEKIHKLIAKSQGNEKHIGSYVLEMEGLFENGFEMNERYLLFKDFDRISYIDLQEPTFEADQIKIERPNMNIDVRQSCFTKLNYIKAIHTGNDSNEIAIVIR